jgi:hypothetical protein
MNRSKDAIKKANDALGFLSEIDDVLLENSQNVIAAKAARVLANNQPAVGSEVSHIDWENAPQWVKDKYPERPKYIPVPEIHSSECMREIPKGECGKHHESFNEDGSEEMHVCYGCDIPKTRDILSARTAPKIYHIMDRLYTERFIGTLDMSQFPPNMGDRPNYRYMVNFVHPDLKDLYE